MSPEGSQSSPRTIDQGSSKWERFVYVNRYKLALAVVIVEALLVALSGISLWLVLVIGGLVLALFLLVRQELSGLGRQLAWVGAASQAIAVLVFVLVLVAAILVIVAVVVLALAVLGALFWGRR